MTTRQEFNGKTLDEALASAARAFGTDVTLLSYNILPQAGGGLFSKLFQRGVRLEAWVDDKNDVQAAAREAVRQAMAGTPEKGDRPTPRERNSSNKEKRPRQGHSETNSNRAAVRLASNRHGRREVSQDAGPKRQHSSQRPKAAHEQVRPASHQNLEPTASDPTLERANRPRSALTSEDSKRLLVELAARFALGFDPEVEQSPKLEFLDEEEVIVNVEAPNLEQLLIQSDRLSCAFEHLFKRIAQKRFGDVSGRVTLNAGKAAQGREEKLRTMALDVAVKVKETGKTITLSSKSSQERRIIHLALESMEGIATKSVGVGENRKLIIYSTNRPKRTAEDSQVPESRQRHGERGRAAGGQPRWSNNMQGTGEAGGQQQPRRSRRRGRRGGGGGANRHGGRHDDAPEQSSESRSPEQQLTLPPINS